MNIEGEQNLTLSSEMVDVLMQFFVNRTNVYAVQTSKGLYTKVDGTVTTEVLQRHLKGDQTVGLYQLDRENNVKWLTFDLDPEKLENPKAVAVKLVETCLDKKRFYKSNVWLEASRFPDPSYHIWLLFWPKLNARAARWLGKRIIELANLDPKTIELFPKQIELTKDRPYGNLVKVPLGLHRKAQEWSCFLDLESLEPLPREAICEAWGCHFSGSDLAKIERLADKQRGLQTKISYDVTTTFKDLKSNEERRIARFLTKYWRKGHRHDLNFAFLGWAIKRGISFESAYRIMEEVTKAKNEGERDRTRALEQVRYHYKHRRSIGAKLLGISGLKEIVKETLK